MLSRAGSKRGPRSLQHFYNRLSSLATPSVSQSTAEAQPTTWTAEELMSIADLGEAQATKPWVPDGEVVNMSLVDRTRTPKIEPVWTKPGNLALDEMPGSIDCTGLQMTNENGELNPDIVAKMRQVYKEHGIVHLTNTGLTELSQMRPWVEVVQPQRMTYEGGANSRDAIEENVYDTGAPAVAWLHYHHEMAYVGKSVQSIGFCCNKATEGKGWMYVSDNKKCTEEILKTPFGQRLKEKGICYIRCLTDKKACTDREVGWNGLDEYGIYNHWQRSFGVECPEEAQRKAEERGLQVEWGEHNYMKTKYYTDVFEYHKETDMNHLYASVADDSIWFDTWPGVMDLPSMQEYKTASMAERPLKITYGDDTEFTREELQQLVDVYDNYGSPVRWKVGDVAVMCNWRWAHGRPEYTLEEGETRNLGVVLGEPFMRKGQDNSKW